jgi:hypothetical protein
LRQDIGSFKDTCFLIYSKEVPFALYGPHLKRYMPVPTYLMKRTVGKFAVIARNGAKYDLRGEYLVYVVKIFGAV